MKGEARLRPAPRAWMRRFMAGESMRDIARTESVTEAVVDYRLWLLLFTPAERRRRRFLARARAKRERMGLVPRTP